MTTSEELKSNGFMFKAYMPIVDDGKFFAVFKTLSGNFEGVLKLHGDVKESFTEMPVDFAVDKFEKWKGIEVNG